MVTVLINCGSISLGMVTMNENPEMKWTGLKRVLSGLTAGDQYSLS
jgi:hypothetical protein